MEEREKFLEEIELQKIQEIFTQVGQVYIEFYDLEGNCIVPSVGTEAEQQFLGQIPSDWESECGQVRNCGIETCLQQITSGHIRVCLIPAKFGKKSIGYWKIYGVLEGADVPNELRKISEREYEKSVMGLLALSGQYFALKWKEIQASNQEYDYDKKKYRYLSDHRKNAVMTEILKTMGSKDAFVEMVEQILGIACGYMGISYASLIQLDSEERYLEVIGQWGDARNGWQAKKKVSREELPFLGKRPYIVSNKTALHSKARQFLIKNGIEAIFIMPIEIREKIHMYLVFASVQEAHEWKSQEIQLIKDMRHLLQEHLEKRITVHSITSSYLSLEGLLENIGCGIYVQSMDSQEILYVNQVLRSMLKDVADHYICKVFREEDLQKRTEIYIRETDSWLELQQTTIRWVDGQEVLLGTLYDITEKKEYQLEIERQANRDFLTGLCNRRKCEEDLSELLSREVNAEGAMLYLDLDDFKHINDGLGHAYGDELICSIAKRLVQIAGLENNCYRVGADEFIVLVMNYQFEQMQQILTEIRNLFVTPWFLKGTDYYCTISIGVVRFPSDGTQCAELFKKADIALYEAKRKGKNRVEYYDVGAEFVSIRRLDLEKNMRNATIHDCEGFQVYYQPIVDITREEAVCVGAEALIRWDSEELGFLSPTEFIPLAEYLGLINPIGQFVLKQACKECKKWNDLGHPEYKVHVNLSIIQLLQKGMITNIAYALEESQIEPKNLILEVTESQVIHDMGQMKQILATIKEMGVLVALDDFGTGYSSLNRVREMPVDVLKVDQCFVRDLGRDEFAAAFIKSVCDLAKVLHVNVCVEGVEEERQYKVLREIGVDQIQGFYFGRPTEAENFQKRYVHNG